MRAAAIASSFLLLVAFAHAAEPMPSADDLQKLQDAKDWPGLLQATTRVLTLKGPAAAGIDRVDAWFKKGEAQLQSAQFVPASQSFEKAAGEPGIAPDKADLAIAIAAVMRKSDRHGYKPPAGKGGGADAYDVLDPAKRPAAIAALFDVTLADVSGRVDKLKATTNAGPMLELIKQAHALQPIDRVVNHSTDKTDALDKALGTAFATAAKDWSDTNNQRLTEIQADADTQTKQYYKDNQGRQQVRMQRKGLLPAAQGEVRKMMQSAEGLAGTFTTIDKALSPPGQETAKPAKAAIQATYDQAKTVLSASYRLAQ